MSRTLKFNDPNDIRLGFLSNRSRYGFTIDGKRWPTVEHYIQGRRFCGTQMERKIREATTIFQMRTLLKAKIVTTIEHGTVVKRKVYGDRKSTYHPLDIDLYDTMLLAVRAKFTQSNKLKERLIRTAGIHLVDTSSKLTGIVLEKVRQELLEAKLEGSLLTETACEWDWTTDIDETAMTEQERTFIVGYVRALMLMVEVEHADRLYPQMYYDVTANICRSKRLLSTYYSSSKKLDWTWAYSNLPNHFSMVYECRDTMVGVASALLKNKKRRAVSIKSELDIVANMDTDMAALIRWYRLYRTKELRRAVKKVQALTIDTIKLIKGRRSYRGQVSSKTHVILTPKPPPAVVKPSPVIQPAPKRKVRKKPRRKPTTVPPPAVISIDKSTVDVTPVVPQPTPIVQDIMPAEPIVSVQPEEPQSILDVKEPPIPSSVMVVYDESPNKKVSEESPLPVAGLDPRLSKAMDAIHATSDDTEVIMCDLGALEPHEKERFYSQLEQAMPSEEALRDIFML